MTNDTSAAVNNSTQSNNSNTTRSNLLGFFMLVNEIKFNCSEIYSLIGNAAGNSPVTDIEFKKLFNLLGRDYQELSEPQKATARDIMLKEINYEPNKLSDSVLSALVEIYSFEMYGKGKVSKGNVYPHHLEKGNLAEIDAIKFLSTVDGINYEKNTELFSNKWFKGIPDIVIKSKKGKVSKIIEIKLAPDLPTYLLNIKKPEKFENILEVMGYMDICKCENAEIVHVLVNTPAKVIELELQRYKDRYEHFELSQELADSRLFNIKNNMTFDEIDNKVKVFRRPVSFNKLTIGDAKKRVTKAREWLKELHELFTKPLSL